MNSFGTLFRVTIFGESHGKALGITVDGVPPGIELKEDDFLRDLKRRKAGKKGTTPRKEPDIPQIISGVHEGFTTGAPLTILCRNENSRSGDYEKLKDIPRPGHADFTAGVKYFGFADRRGSGHFSGRMTLGLVAAGVIAKKVCRPMIFSSRILSLHGSNDFDREIREAIDAGDSIGGIIETTVDKVDPGLGEPFFGSVESLLSHIVFSIPAIRGIEFGDGFRAAEMRGCEHNDSIVEIDGKTETNHSGGINGGITSGNQVVFRAAVKPASSISLPQNTINVSTGKIEELTIEGRHDVCIPLRMPIVLEAASAIVFADLLLQRRAYLLSHESAIRKTRQERPENGLERNKR